MRDENLLMVCPRCEGETWFECPDCLDGKVYNVGAVLEDREVWKTRAEWLLDHDPHFMNPGFWHDDDPWEWIDEQIAEEAQR